MFFKILYYNFIICFYIQIYVQVYYKIHIYIYILRILVCKVYVKVRSNLLLYLAPLPLSTMPGKKQRHCFVYRDLLNLVNLINVKK